MTNIVIHLLQKPSIEFRLLTITVDNVTFNKLLRTNFKVMLFDNNANSNCQKSIIRCIIHVMQLMLDAIFKVLKV